MRRRYSDRFQTILGRRAARTGWRICESVEGITIEQRSMVIPQFHYDEEIVDIGFKQRLVCQSPRFVVDDPAGEDLFHSPMEGAVQRV